MESCGQKVACFERTVLFTVCNEFPDCHVYLFCVWQACLPDPWPTCWSRFRFCFEGPPAAALWTPEQAASTAKTDSPS